MDPWPLENDTSVYLALSPQQIWLVPLPTGWYNFLLTVNVSHPNISIQTLHTVLKVLTKRTCLDIKSFNTSFIFPDFNVWFRGDNVWRELMKLWENLSKFIPDTQKKTFKKKTHLHCREKVHVYVSIKSGIHKATTVNEVS